MKTFRHKLRFPVFGDYPVQIVFCDNIHKEAKRAKHVLPSDDGSEEAYTAVTTSGCICVFNRTPDAETVAHEAYHAIVALLKFSGANTEEELVAYHLGYLVGHITKWKEKDHAKAVHSDARQISERGNEQSSSTGEGS
jgi:hypothetical protein